GAGHSNRGSGSRCLGQNLRDLVCSFREHNFRRIAAFQVTGIRKIILNFVWLSFGQHDSTTQNINHRGDREETISHKRHEKHKRNYQPQPCVPPFSICAFCAFWWLILLLCSVSSVVNSS